jgi:dinuclear metal center YbgI/SA1388 family protein
LNKYEIVKKIENFAPLDTQEPWDCSGWIVDDGFPEVKKVLFALTITDSIYEQAMNKGCDMIISHHPLFTVPVKYKNINMYCAHTNFDKAFGGTTDLLLKELGFVGEPYGDFVRIVDFEKEMSPEFLKVKLLYVSPKLKTVNNCNIKTIKRVGFCAGSGSEFISETPCDAFVTGDIKFHTAVEADKVLFDIGHFESEIFAVKFFREITELSEREGVIAHEKSPFD